MFLFNVARVDVFSDEFNTKLEAARPARPSELKRFELVVDENGTEEVILRDVDGGKMSFPGCCCC